MARSPRPIESVCGSAGAHRWPARNGGQGVPALLAHRETRRGGGRSRGVGVIAGPLVPAQAASLTDAVDATASSRARRARPSISAFPGPPSVSWTGS